MNVQTRMLEIANQLGHAYTEKAMFAVSVTHGREDYDNRLLAIRPEGGWPGKNEDERKAARELAARNDETLKAINARRVENEIKLENFMASIAALEAERRALEWFLKGEFIALNGGRTDVNFNSQPIVEPAMEKQMEPQMTEPEREVIAPDVGKTPENPIKVEAPQNIDDLMNKIHSMPAMAEQDDLPF